VTDENVIVNDQGLVARKRVLAFIHRRFVRLPHLSLGACPGALVLAFRVPFDEALWLVYDELRLIVSSSAGARHLPSLTSPEGRNPSQAEQNGRSADLNACSLG